MKVIDPQWIISIIQYCEFSYYIEILDQTGEVKMTQPVDESLQYYIDENQRLFTWLGAQGVNN